MTLRGRIKNGVVVLEDDKPSLPEGTVVEVRPLDVFAEQAAEPPSKERQEALRSLIGIWKMENPPNDEEVERIIDEARMEKYG